MMVSETESVVSKSVSYKENITTRKNKNDNDLKRVNKGVQLLCIN